MYVCVYVYAVYPEARSPAIWNSVVAGFKMKFPFVLIPHVRPVSTPRPLNRTCNPDGPTSPKSSIYISRPLTSFELQASGCPGLYLWGSTLCVLSGQRQNSEGLSTRPRRPFFEGAAERV